jgi:hypothetical protein
MPHYLCPSCLHVTQCHERSPFNWCGNCGQTLDAVSLLTESVPLAEHTHVTRLERRARFAQVDGQAPVAGPRP